MHYVCHTTVPRSTGHTSEHSLRWAQCTKHQPWHWLYKCTRLGISDLQNNREQEPAYIQLPHPFPVCLIVARCVGTVQWSYWFLVVLIFTCQQSFCHTGATGWLLSNTSILLILLVKLSYSASHIMASEQSWRRNESMQLDWSRQPINPHWQLGDSQKQWYTRPLSFSFIYPVSVHVSVYIHNKQSWWSSVQLQAPWWSAEEAIYGCFLLHMHASLHCWSVVWGKT